MPRRRSWRPPYVEPEDDGLVGYRGGAYSAWFVEENSRVHMDGFDGLPSKLRDAINYAPTPETGALPTRDLVKHGGPHDRIALKSRAITAATLLAIKLAG